MSEILRAEVQALRAYIKKLEDAIKRGDLNAARETMTSRLPLADVHSGAGE